MKSTALDVTSYVAEAPEGRRAALQILRQLCQEHLTGYEECIEYGMPAYRKNGAVEVAFASQKQYISLYILKKDVVDAHRDALAGCNIGKGCIRFRSPAQIDFGVVRSMLKQTVESKGGPC
jgi:uncharacterized protein YdhG (YjbR/CyaY superfamily)